ncbi:hypothetical protein GCM10020331_047180 [Ectobacillus funiculus]
MARAGMDRGVWYRRSEKKMCEVNMLPPVPTARVNVSKTTVEEALVRLKEEGVEARRGELAKDAIFD